MSDGTLSPNLRRDAELVAAVCMSVAPEDIVTIVTDDAHLDEAQALAQVVVERGGYPVIACSIWASWARNSSGWRARQQVIQPSR